MKNKISLFFKKIFDTLSNCVVPIIPILIGAGMVKVLLLILGDTVFGILSADSSTYIVLSFVADAGFYFLPIFIAVSSAEEFKTNKYLAAFVCSTLLSPTFISFVDEGISLSIFNLPITSATYSNQIISSILCVWIMSYVVRFFDKVINKNIKSILTPLLTLLIMIPLTFCLIGPLGVWAGEYLVKFIYLVKDLGPVGNGIVCALLPFAVVFGLGGGILSALLLLMATGCDPIFYFDNVIYNCVIGSVTLALYLKNKDGECLGAVITGIVAGFCEPCLFGYVIKDKKSMGALVAACFIAGTLSGILGVKGYAIASFGIFGSIATISPTMTIVPALTCILVGCVLGFTFNYFLHLKDNKHA